MRRLVQLRADVAVARQANRPKRPALITPSMVLDPSAVIIRQSDCDGQETLRPNPVPAIAVESFLTAMRVVVKRWEHTVRNRHGVIFRRFQDHRGRSLRPRAWELEGAHQCRVMVLPRAAGGIGRSGKSGSQPPTAHWPAGPREGTNTRTVFLPDCLAL